MQIKNAFFKIHSFFFLKQFVNFGSNTCRNHWIGESNGHRFGTNNDGCNVNINGI